MASTTLFPPIVDSYTSAFIASGGSAYCRVYYSLSKFSSSVDNIKSIHFSIVKQSSGQSVVNRKENSEGRYRSTGIVVLNTKPIAVSGQENLYYTDILNEDIKGGWTPGWMYKIQIRFGTSAYTDGTIGLASWLNLNANNFSEWSTYTVTKAIGKPVITIPNFNYNSSVIGNGANKSQTHSIFNSTMELTGSYSNADDSEILYSYRLKLYGADGGLLEDSKLIYANQYTPNQLYYLFETEFKDGLEYRLELNYETLNHYIDTKVFDLVALISSLNAEDIEIKTAEDLDGMQRGASIEEDQTGGRISLRLYSEKVEPYFGNICIRRSDSKSNFAIWEDIKIIPIVNQVINELPIIYDYTVESGVWYKYGIQVIDSSGFRSTLVEHEPIKREFEYAFLLGENDQQLRLLYNNTMGNFKHTFSESKIDTIGAKHPYIIRNGNMNYKTFPINGLISFTMDLDNLFTTKEEIYKYSTVVELYNRNKEVKEYDYTYERDFRNKVLEFLQDGKPKLFKSPTEGNIIVRLMDVNTTPNDTLGRLIYSFTANAYEIDDPTVDNYFKYNFYTVGEFQSKLVYTETRLGQFIGTVPVGSNLFELIANKYGNPDLLGNIQTVTKIQNLVLRFPGDGLSVKNSAGQLVSGNNITVNGNLITIKDGFEYNFDELVSYTPSDSLIIEGDAKGQVKTVEVEADFVLEVSVTPIEERMISTQTVSKNIGQLAETMYVGDSAYSKVYYKYFYEWKDSFRKLYELKCVCLEADPGTMFIIKDSDDKEGELHIMNSTGILNLSSVGAIEDIIYAGRIDDETAPADVIIDYLFYLLEGDYAEEV